MFLLRPKRIAVLILTITSLLVSAVSACACGHHQTVRMTHADDSCQKSSHSAMNLPSSDVSHSASSEGISDAIDEECSCPARVQVPATVSKSDQKQHSAAKKLLFAGFASPDLSFSYSAAILSQPIFDQRRIYLSAKPFRSISPRAPPRL